MRARDERACAPSADCRACAPPRRRRLSRRFEADDALPAFRAELLRKDLRLAVELADDAGAPAPFIAAAKADYDEIVDARGWGGRACTVARAVQEERAGSGKLEAALGAAEHRALLRDACQLDVAEYDDDALAEFAAMLDAAKRPPSPASVLEASKPWSKGALPQHQGVAHLIVD